MASEPVKPPHPIIIRQVANGYLVEGVPSEYSGTVREENRVFQSFNELHGFLRGHFTHRSPLLSSDSNPES